MSNKKLSASLVLFVLATSITGLAALNATADDNETTKDKKQPAPQVATEADEFAVPQDVDIDKLVNFIRTMMQRDPKGATRDEQIADYIKSQKAAIAGADKLYEISLDDKEQGLAAAGLAAQVKFRALQSLKQFGDETVSAQLKQFGQTLAKDQRAQIAEIGDQMLLQLRFELAANADEATVKKLADDLRSTFGEGEIELNSVRIVMQALQQLERSDHPALAADLYRFFSKRFSQSSDDQVAGLADRFEGTARRLDLPGNPIELNGTFLDGTKLDWESYRGKVVLVDFWATWCGPCIAELPNVLTNYEEYHDKGFDVVAISLDSDREKVEAFVKDRDLPWKSLFSDDPEANGWKHPMATKYGIGAIPAVLLVDKEGNVASLNARGPELGRLLGEMLGDDTATTDAAD